MPENNTAADAQQPDFAAMTQISVSPHWWIKLPDGRLKGPFGSRETVEDTFSGLFRDAMNLGMGVRFGMDASIVTTTRYFMESPAEIDYDATAAARHKAGEDW